jgi:hypothetical protein
MRYDLGGVHLIVDYAHNPEGLRGVLAVADQLRRGGRLGLLLGHAGNRQDEDLEAVARVAAGFRPDLVVVKENESHLRGRAPGEIPRILRAALLAAGLPSAALPTAASELEAVELALGWARPGDAVALLVHSLAARQEVLARLAAPGARVTVVRRCGRRRAAPGWRDRGARSYDRPTAPPAPVSSRTGKPAMKAHGMTPVVVMLLVALSALLPQASALAKPRPASDANGMPQGMDCEKLASMPAAPMSVESCRQMLAAQQAYQASANDPAAVRPGDEQMSCAQISAELAQQQVGAPDPSKAEAAKAATSAFQAKSAEQQAEARATAVRQDAELKAAEAADRHVQVATGGIVQGSATRHVAEAQQAQNRKRGAEMYQEIRPLGDRMTNAVGSLGVDMGAQLTANPRLARLLKLASDKRCKGP